MDQLIFQEKEKELSNYLKNIGYTFVERIKNPVLLNVVYNLRIKKIPPKINTNTFNDKELGILYSHCYAYNCFIGSSTFNINKHLNKGVKLNNEYCLNGMAGYYEIKGDIPNMLKYYEMGIKNNSIVSIGSLGIYYHKTGDFDKMKIYYNMMLEKMKNINTDDYYNTSDDIDIWTDIVTTNINNYLKTIDDNDYAILHYTILNQNNINKYKHHVESLTCYL